MSLENFYRDAMALNTIADMEKRKEAAKAFFEKLNQTTLPEKFNWAAEIFEGVHVKERGDQLALIWTDLDTDAERQFTYRELAENGNKFLNFIRKKGVAKGNNLYMLTPIVPETWFASFAGIKGGLVSVPTATTMTEREIQFRFESYKPDVIVAFEGLTQLVDDALVKANCTPKAKIVLGKKDGWVSYEEISAESGTADAADVGKDDVLFCFFTSGTTGLPKRVGHSATSYPVGHLSTAVIQGLEPGGIHHNLSAPGWAKWAWSSFFAPLNIGATATGFAFTALDPEKYVATIAKYKVNSFCAPPTAWRAFVRLDLSKYDFSAIKYSLSAGEPLNPEVIDRWSKATGTEIRDFYGQTESTAMIGNPPWMEGKMRFGSFGYPSDMYDVILTDDEGNEITTPDEPGHIVIRLSRWRALGLFQEYIDDPEKTHGAFKGSMYFTGDKASFDKDGYWWFVGRSDDVIKSSDYRVGPFEVESALIEHPSVMEAAVVGTPDPTRYQLVKAYVILNKGYQPSRDLALELFQHTIKVLAKFKIPRIIEFVEELPKTISGKIRRVELREDEERKKKGESVSPNEYFYHQFPELSSKKK
ncbi:MULTISPECIES: acyl-CoA synthetase [Desulfococcus]|jgi:acetyl-CoA synthetase/4-hydroxybutyrate---CoA ligase (AMP-forming)|uniref:AMP-dependent synthetase and ligase n=1 Tax=Desulfococcus multivorans DSM 2059 TaxID=1121405 RepID=S7U0Q1_DESML|nr:AMP-binding protein [Desulfococcus multivorans]AOY58355.1 AcsA2: acetyl-coenzyme A synthetase (acetate--CoA ligase) [Desulfococcus multivorans]AQV00687.1 acetyl-CoA synthetase [Desulfococcus multivorans]EPR42570.1 AMP-dependent synthetase and ligase [Desulfococcus multivorans DSM 2059]MDX9819901.1 AMP-binding protein [Desulfococcus multivorans]SKA18470.1 acetyl-CoA synthetase [Desulfococcus multivorans DSM 2059]